MSRHFSFCKRVRPPPPIKRAEGRRTSTNARQANQEVCQDAFSHRSWPKSFLRAFFPKGMRWPPCLERSDTRGSQGLAKPPLIRRHPFAPAQYLHLQIDVR